MVCPPTSTASIGSTKVSCWKQVCVISLVRRLFAINNPADMLVLKGLLAVALAGLCALPTGVAGDASTCSVDYTMDGNKETFDLSVLTLKSGYALSVHLVPTLGSLLRAAGKRVDQLRTPVLSPPHRHPPALTALLRDFDAGSILPSTHGRTTRINTTSMSAPRPVAKVVARATAENPWETQTAPPWL